GTFVPGTDPVAITGLGGRYRFVVAPGSGYQVRVQAPTGTKLVQTSPTPAPISFAPGSDHTASNVNFRFSPPSSRQRPGLDRRDNPKVRLPFPSNPPGP